MYFFNYDLILNQAHYFLYGVIINIILRIQNMLNIKIYQGLKSYFLHSSV